ncbi:MAG: triose-phosphate isomerase [Candidatus Staskawiczbacteria bacterium]|nr:triose-phosphate isomerase [Candidatus Staskawiczbacteria bacterium]
MKNLIVANWKMNPVSKKEAEDIFSAYGARLPARQGPASGWDRDAVEVVICPPFVYLNLWDVRHPTDGGMSDILVSLGAQNVYSEEKGAFTGEISPAMLKDLGAEYVIIGHSERRKYFGETDETVNKKIKKSLEAGLNVIFCIGETAEERDAGKKNEVLEKQIKNGLLDIENFKFQISNLSVAYEPVWAIGTGNNCSVEETKESVDFIRQFVKPETRVLYGGSVKSDNSADYIKQAGANGLLVGGASLNPEEFIKIVKSAD